LIVDLHASPLLTTMGITKTRDYNTYARAFDAGAGGPKVRPHCDLVVPGESSISAVAPGR